MNRNNKDINLKMKANLWFIYSKTLLTDPRESLYVKTISSWQLDFAGLVIQRIIQDNPINRKTRYCRKFNNLDTMNLN